MPCHWLMINIDCLQHRLCIHIWCWRDGVVLPVPFWDEISLHVSLLDHRVEHEVVWVVAVLCYSLTHANFLIVLIYCTWHDMMVVYVFPLKAHLGFWKTITESFIKWLPFLKMYSKQVNQAKIKIWTLECKTFCLNVVCCFSTDSHSSKTVTYPRNQIQGRHNIWAYVSNYIPGHIKPNFTENQFWHLN